MSHQSASDQEIRNWVLREHGLTVEIAWIADCKQECGIPVDDGSASQRAPFLPLPAGKASGH